MPRRLQQFLALTRLTAIEATRHPICLMLTLACVLCTLLAPLFIVHELGEQGRLARDSALAFQFVIGMLVSGYAACSALRRDVETGVAATVLSKAVSREVFFLSKFAGVAVVVLIFNVCASLATLLSQRVAPENFVVDGLAVGLALAAPALAALAAALENYFADKPFGAHALLYLALFLGLALTILCAVNRSGHWAPFGTTIEWRVTAACALIAASLLVLAAIALVLAIRLKTAPVIALCAAIFVFGLMSDYLFGGSSAGSLAAVAQALLPAWQRFWVADALAGGGVVGAAQLGRSLLYALLYLGGVLCAGTALARHGEMR